MRARARRAGTVRAVVGLVAAAVVALLGSSRLASVVAAVALAGLAIALLWPMTVHATVERVLSAFGRLVGRGLAWLLLVPLFLVFFGAIGRCMRWGRRDALQRFLDPQAPTYFRPHAQRPPGLDPYRRQF